MESPVENDHKGAPFKAMAYRLKSAEPAYTAAGPTADNHKIE